VGANPCLSAITRDPVGGLVLGNSDLENHVMYVRGYYVLHPACHNALAPPDHTIAHELGHVLANTHNEAKAEEKGLSLLKGKTKVVSW
jgi:hypothetical protein